MYNYKELRPTIFKDDGIPRLLIIRDRIHKLFTHSNTIIMESILDGILGDSWENMVCVDYLVELGEITEINKNSDSPAQYHIFRHIK